LSKETKKQKIVLPELVFLEKYKSKLSVSLYFAFIVVAEIIVALGVSYLMTVLIQHVPWIPAEVPSTVWLIIFSVAIGAALAFFLNRLFFKPIRKLSRAMKRVAKGDFTTEISEKNFLHEMQDIYTSFNLMVKELDRTETLQSDFIANVSHEIKTPVTAIEGYAMLLEDGSATEQEREGYVEKILFNTQRLSELVNNVLLLSKLESQAIETHYEEFRMDEQVRQAIMLLEPKWEAKATEFDVEMEEISCVGNAGLFLQVCTNLIGNAIKFGPAGGTVKLRLNGTAEKVVFVVEDQGDGISEEAQQYIFGKFYQVDSSHKEEGNGLGLALVKRIVDLTNGEIGVENVEPKGCRFTVTLPFLRKKK